MTDHRPSLGTVLKGWLFPVLIAAGCAAPEPPSPDFAEWAVLREARNYFELASLVESSAGRSDPEILYYRAVVENAFNRPRSSNRAIGALLEGNPLPERLEVDLWKLRLGNHLRLHQYARVGEAARRLLEFPENPAHALDRREIANTLLLVEALDGVEPQEVSPGGAGTIDLVDGRAGVEIEGQSRRYILDTGANYSVLMRSEAEALGLRIRPVGLEVATSTDLSVRADLAVAGEVSLGGFEYRRVVFLVFDDEALSFPNGFQIHGILGFPLIEAMGEVRFRPGGIEILDTPSPAAESNLALDDLDPLIRVGYDGEWLVCRLDTGAGHTNFYEPFFRRFRDRIEREGTAKTARVGGVGGIREFPAFELAEVSLTIGAISVPMPGLEVYTESIVDSDDNYLDCNVGLDLLQSGGAYTFDFRAMSVTLDPAGMGPAARVLTGAEAAADPSRRR